MMQVHWHLRLTLESSTRERAKEMAQAERRTTPNYVATLIERDQQTEKDKQ